MRTISVALLFASLAFAGRQGATGRGALASLTATVTVAGKTPRERDRADVVVWLSPLGGTVNVTAPPPGRFKIVQQNKRFSPHLLVVPVGSQVDFPNLDPFFHNAFSLFNGRRFDLGLYESGATRGARFNTAGISYIFCNIHSEMTAVVVSLDTPYYGISNQTGEVSFRDVPPGRYALSAWHERYAPERMDQLPREIVISVATTTIGDIRLVETEEIAAPHKNKYGKDYSPVPSGPLYRGGRL